MAEVENATQSLAFPTDDSTSTMVRWENIPATFNYRVVEKTANNDEVVNSSGRGTQEEPFILERSLGSLQARSDRQPASFNRESGRSATNFQSGKFTLKKRNENDRPLAGAEFTLTSEDGRVIKVMNSTDSTDGVVFDGLSQGRYLLKETKSPTGYELLKDYYRIEVDSHGITTVTYVKNADSEKAPVVAANINRERASATRTAKTSGVVDVTSYSLTSTFSNTNNGANESVWMTSGEFIRLQYGLRVKDDVQPGDSFTIKLDEKLSPTGIRERVLPPIPLTANGEVVATGTYDQASNSFTYTFTDYVRTHTDVTLSAQYDTFSADIAKVLNSGTYTFTNIIDGQSQTPKTFYIDYGPSHQMPSGVNAGRKLRNQVASVNRITGEVERIIYINNGNTAADVIAQNANRSHYVQLINNSTSTITNVEVYRVLSSQKAEYMSDSMPGKTDGLEKLDKSLGNDSKITLQVSDFMDKETNKRSAGILIKVTERLVEPYGPTNITARWGYNALIGASADAAASVVDSGASSAGDAALWYPTIAVRNEKVKTTSITVRKKWFTADNQETQRANGYITYNLMQVATSEYGNSQEVVYRENERLSQDTGWSKTYSDLPLSGTNDSGQSVTFTYYVVEASVSGYQTSYISDIQNESTHAKDIAVVSGDITIKNKAQKAYVLPDTGGEGITKTLFLGGFLTSLAIILLAVKFYRVHRGGDFC